MGDDDERVRSILLEKINGKTSDPDSIDEDALEYMLGSIQDESMEREDLVEMLPSFFMDMGCGEDEDEAAEFCTVVLEAIFGVGGTEPEPDVEFKVLSKAVNLTALANADMDAVLARLGFMWGKEVTDTGNSLIKVWDDSNPLSSDEMTDAQLRARAKKAKKDEKAAKKDIKREKANAERRNALLETLKSKAVIVHRDSSCAVVPDIHFDGVTMDIGGKVLLDDVTVVVAAGRRYGLVGKNGDGKTTFLRFMAAHRLPGIPRDVQIVHIEQEIDGDDRSVLSTVLSCDFERDELMYEEEKINKQLDECRTLTVMTAGEAKLTERLGQVHERLIEIGADTAEPRAAIILAGLGFDKDMLEYPTNAFSGGWRMRVSLAMALFIAPDVLLLDEPTNHLDLHAVIWLEDYLQTWTNTLIVVSHARDFLNEVCTDILHLNNKQITRYKGNYDTFEKVQHDKFEQQASAHDAQQKHREHLQSFIDKFRCNAKRAAMAQSRIKALQRMQLVPAALKQSQVSFIFPKPDNMISGSVVQLVDVGFGYKRKDAAGERTLPPKELLFNGVNLGVDMHSRVALVGPNGIGKSTMLKIITNELEPTTGEVTVNSKLRIGKFSQHHVDGMDMKKTPLEIFQSMSSGVGGASETLAIRGHLGSMGLPGSLALQPCHTLSGGQKSRVAFALMTWHKPHMLLLDEPTNHLDLETVNALVTALLAFEGGILLVSHDEHLCTSVCDRLWVADGKTVGEFPGTFKDYKAQEIKKIKSH